MKKIFIPVLCFLFLAGCTMNVQPDNTNSNTSAVETTTEPTAKAVEAIADLSKSKVIWGPGNIENHQQPTDPKELQQNFAKYGAEWLLSDEKSVWLTFDEGYENGFTPAILDILKEKNVKAVFFVTYDFASENPDLIKRMIDEGHTVGNHSWHHYSMDELDDDSARDEVMYLHDFIKNNFNYTMSYFRFPKGEFSERSLAIVNELGYKSVFWSYAYADWEPDSQPEPDRAFTNICESTHPGEIILLHAVSETNAKILGKVIDDIRRQGYSFRS